MCSVLYWACLKAVLTERLSLCSLCLSGKDRWIWIMSHFNPSALYLHTWSSFSLNTLKDVCLSEASVWSLQLIGVGSWGRCGEERKLWVMDTKHPITTFRFTPSGMFCHLRFSEPNKEGHRLNVTLSTILHPWGQEEDDCLPCGVAAFASLKAYGLIARILCLFEPRARVRVSQLLLLSLSSVTFPAWLPSCRDNRLKWEATGRWGRQVAARLLQDCLWM